METTNAKQPLSGSSQTLISQSVKSNFRNLYLLNGDTLLPLAPEYLDSNSPAEKVFRSEKELQELVLQNSRTFFGQHTFIVTFQKKDGILFGNDFVPTGFMFDVSNSAKPRFFILDIMLAKQSFFGYIFPRITKYFSFFKSEENINKICELIGKDKELKKVLQANMESENISAYLKNAITIKPFILLVLDSEITEMQEVTDIYPETWQSVKQILIQKYASGGNTFCTMSPPFAMVNRLERKERKSREVISYTEEYHLEKALESVREIYNTVKTELLKADDQLQFNPQKYYVSLRKNRSMAFFHFSHKKISLVVMNPEKDTRRAIKYHVVKSLTPKVQQFWGHESCTIVIENTTHLNEVTDLLKKMIAV